MKVECLLCGQLADTCVELISSETEPSGLSSEFGDFILNKVFSCFLKGQHFLSKFESNLKLYKTEIAKNFSQFKFSVAHLEK